MKQLSLAFFIGVLLLAACSEQPSEPVDSGQQDALRTAAPEGHEGNIDFRNRYIVVFRESVGNVDDVVQKMTRGNGSVVHYRYHHAIRGFCATIPEQALEGIRHNPNVAYIEADKPMYASVTQSPVPSWGLDRIDQRDLPLNGSYVYDNDGSGITVYIIDTGILYNHVEFGNPTRATFGYDAFGGDGSDLNGHGTHVSGTVGGYTVGVAKGVSLVSVRVLDRTGSGSYSGVIAGVDWVAGDHDAEEPAIANMSLGGPFSQSVNDAVEDAISDGVTFVVAAGNESTLAEYKSPASAPHAITVGATTSTDGFAYYSNYGDVVDILAPGSSIYSSYKKNPTSYATMSGTSMASPHVAGVAALYLKANSGSTPAQIAAALTSTSGGATWNTITSVPSGTPNCFLYSLVAGVPSSNPPPAPTGLTATAKSSSEIDLSWTAVSGASSYEIEISHDGASNFVAFGTATSTTASYAWTGLNSSTTYYFRVRAFDGTLYSGYSNIADATTDQASSVTETWVTAASGSSAWVNKVSWSGTLTVRIMDAKTGGSAVAGATVTIAWSGAASGSSTAVTDQFGDASVSTGPLNVKKISSVGMSVTGVSGTNITFKGYVDTTLDPLTVSAPSTP